VYEVLATSFFLAMAYEGGWPVLSLAVSSSHWQSAVSVLLIDELAMGRRWNRNLEPKFLSWPWFEEPQTSRLAVQHANH